MLVPQGPGLYGSLDRGMGHKRRFSRVDLSKTLESAGFKVERTRQLNKIGARVLVDLSAKLLRRKRIGQSDPEDVR